MDMSDLHLFQKFAPKVPEQFKEGKNAVIYTRVSSADQEDNTSLESQKKHCEIYANRKGFNIVRYFGGTYESAKTDDRKEFNKMLAFVKRSKNLNYVIVYSYERFSRSGINGASIADELLKKHGVMTIAVTQELDPSTPAGSFQQKILFLFGQMDNEMRKDKVVTAMKELLLKGHWVWGIPRGYDNLNKGCRASERKLVVNGEGKKLKKAFEWKAYKNLPLVEICKRLKKIGVTINECRLHEIFTNPFYCGLLTSKLLPGKVIEGKHEGMVSRELFLAVNNVRVKNRVHGFVRKKESENLPLKVFAKCDKCGQTLTGYIAKDKKLYYYKCRTVGCRVNRSAIAMHGIFKDVLKAYTIDKGAFEVVKAQLNEQTALFFKEKVEQAKYLKATYNEAKKKLDTIEERYAIGEIDRILYEKYQPKYEKECVDLNDQISRFGNYSSTLEKVQKYALDITLNLLTIWESSNLDGKKVLQNMLFPEGIYYNREKDLFRAKRANSFFTIIGVLSGNYSNKNSNSPGHCAKFFDWDRLSGVEAFFTT